MKISLDAAMRARDVSQPAAADEIAAAEQGIDSRRDVASEPKDQPGQSRRLWPHGRPRPGHGSAGASEQDS